MSGNLCYIIGKGGHAKVISSTLKLLNIDFKFIVKAVNDKNEDIHENDFLKQLEVQKAHVICGIGKVDDKNNRIKVIERFSSYENIEFFNVIHPTAYISKEAVICRGVYIGPMAVINPGAHISHHTIINTSSIIEHDAYIDDYTHVACGAVCLGESVIGKNCLIGANSTVLQCIKVHNNSILGAGSTLTNHTNGEGTYVGTPAFKK